MNGTSGTREAALDTSGRSAGQRSQWERSAAAAGFVFVAIGVVSSFLPGTPPASDASAAKVAAYFRDHAGAIEAQQVIGMLGIVALLWWFGSLWGAIDRIEGERPVIAAVAAVSLAVGVAMAVASGAMTATAAMRVGSIGEGSQLLWTLSLVTIASAGFAIASFVGAVCVVNLQGTIAPTWTNALGAIAALAFVVAGVGAGTDASSVNVFGLLAFLVWCGWIVAVTVYLRRGEPDSSRRSHTRAMLAKRV